MNAPLNRLFRRIAPITAVALVLTALAATAQGQSDEQLLEQMMRASKARAAIVQQASAAVVHISVEKTVTRGGEEGEAPSPFDDPFFRRFFGPRMPFPPREFRQRGLGTGLIVDSNGYILTNNHVVAEADEITVKLPDGRQFKATKIGTDEPTDLAVVQIDGQNLPSANLGDSDGLQVGETVIAIGNPFGLEQTVTSGIVSAKGRSELGLSQYEDFIQTDASINPGNSGGPLINLRGDVVAINTAIFSRSGGNQGIGFAIPINTAREVMQQLIEKGKVTRGFLGVVIQDVTPELANALGIDVNAGVLIANVGPDTPAEAAGIRQGDVIVRFNEQRVTSSNELRNVVAAVQPDTTVPVELLRDGERMSVRVTVAEQPEDMTAAFQEGEQQPQPQPEQQEPQAMLGMMLQPLTPNLAEQLGYQGLNGLVVTEVQQGSPAEDAGLQRGALIIEANRQEVRSIADLRRVIAEVPSGRSVLLLVRFGQFSRYVGIRKP